MMLTELTTYTKKCLRTEFKTAQTQFTRLYPKFSETVAWSENCKWYSSLPLGAVVSLFCGSV